MEEVIASVIVTVRDGADALPMWLAHMEQQSFPSAALEILVVDRGSGDDSARVVERHAGGTPVRTRCLRLGTVNVNEALNTAAHEAEGRFLLFLDLNLVTGPKWVETLVRVQESLPHGACAISRLERHPQLDAEVLTPWFLPESRWTCQEGATPHPLDCSTSNLCAPRNAFFDAEGFGLDPDLAPCAGALLALRLELMDIPRVFVGDTSVYAWRPARFKEERWRYYALGYALRRFGQQHGFRAIQQRFRVARNPLRSLIDVLSIPFYVRACEQAEENVGAMGIAYRRMLRHDLYRGYHDARKGLPSVKPV